MALTTCPRCNRIFDKVRSSVCTKCQEAEDGDYDKIRTVLDRSPGLNAEQVAEEAGVPVACVMRMLDEGLIANAGFAKDVKCGMCGAPAISMSRKLCQACLEKLNAQVARQQASLKLKAKGHVQVGAYMQARKGVEEKRRGGGSQGK